MRLTEKKSFLKAITAQIEKYERTLLRKEKYIGSKYDCPICALYYDYSAKTFPACLKCPLLNFRIYNFDKSEKCSCIYRRTYPSHIRDIIKVNSYNMEGEKAALNFWNKMLKFTKRKAASQISFEENSPFVMQMIWIDKVIATYWEREIKKLYK